MSTPSTGPAAGTLRPIVTTGLTQVNTPHGLTIYTNQPSGSVINYTVTSTDGTVSTGSVTVD